VHDIERSARLAAANRKVGEVLTGLAAESGTKG
jgi:hypothetical protein